MTLIFAPVSFPKSGPRRCKGSAICGPVKVSTFTVTPSNCFACDAAGVAAISGSTSRISTSSTLQRCFITHSPPEMLLRWSPALTTHSLSPDPDRHLPLPIPPRYPPTGSRPLAGAQAAEALHQRRAALSEVTRQVEVVAIQWLVETLLRRTRTVRSPLRAPHPPDRSAEIDIAARGLPRRGGGIDGGAYGRGMLHRGCQDFPANDIRGELQQQGVSLGQTPAGNYLCDGHAACLEGFDDPPRAKRGGFQQRPVNFVRFGRHRQADEQTGEICIDKRCPAPVPPVQGHDACLTRPQPSRLFFQRLVRRVPGADTSGGGAAHKPLKDVPNRRLARLVAKDPRHDPVLHDTGNPRNGVPAAIHQQVAGGRPHNGHQLAGLDRANGGQRRVPSDTRHSDQGGRDRNRARGPPAP